MTSHLIYRVGNLTQWISLVTDRERPKYSKRGLSLCYFPLHHKSSMDFSGQVDVYSPELLQHTLSGLFKQFCNFHWAVMMVCFECVKARTQHDYHHDTKVKPEAATAVIELLMVGGKTSETCWAVNKHQDNKLKNCCIRLVIYLNCTMMYGLTNLKF
jgi:hypothetical protein